MPPTSSFPLLFSHGGIFVCLVCLDGQFSRAGPVSHAVSEQHPGVMGPRFQLGPPDPTVIEVNNKQSRDRAVKTPESSLTPLCD